MAYAVIALIAFLLFFCYVFIALAISHAMGVPFVPTNSWHYQNIFDAVSAKGRTSLGPKDVFYDIGSGDGSIVRFVAGRYGAQAYGIEKNWLLVWYARLAQIINNRPAHHIIREDALNYSYSNASVIYLYLFPELIQSLVPHFEKDCKKETIIISHRFNIPQWEKKKIYFEPHTRTHYYRLR